MGGHMTYLEQAESIEACQLCGKDFDVSTLPKSYLDAYALCLECRLRHERGELSVDEETPDEFGMDEHERRDMRPFCGDQ